MASILPNHILFHTTSAIMIAVGYAIFLLSLDWLVVKDHLISWSVAYITSGLVFLAITGLFAYYHHTYK
jgi:hypothetical protein